MKSIDLFTQKSNKMTLKMTLYDDKRFFVFLELEFICTN